MAMIAHPHIGLDERGVAWIDDTNVKEIEVVLNRRLRREAGARALTDPELLDRAAELGRVLFTRDADLLGEATQRQRTDRSFTGLVYAHLEYIDTWSL